MFLLLQVIIQQNKHNCSKRLFEKQPLDDYSENYMWYC
jgi:hypothetical protein